MYYIILYNMEWVGVAAHSNILAWRFQWPEGPGGLQSMGSQRINTTEAQIITDNENTGLKSKKQIHHGVRIYT